MNGRLVIMGSGETAPTMVEVHRATLRAAGTGTSLLLDTPYGFQENADDITDKAVAYFGRNVGRTVTPLVWRSRLEGAALDRALTAVRTARSVFAGPGSPTYALRVWAATGFDDALAAVAASGGTVTFASAAALTIGVVTVPVYEIYKSGADPAWTEGTNLLERLTGLRAALIPHYDNTEGGTHSTRYCYLGERRLRFLESLLPEGAHVIGVDEHTALVFDLATGMASVLGNGTVTVRRDGRSRVLPTGTVLAVGELAELAPAGNGGVNGDGSGEQAGTAGRGGAGGGGGGATAGRRTACTSQPGDAGAGGARGHSLDDAGRLGAATGGAGGAGARGAGRVGAGGSGAGGPGTGSADNGDACGPGSGAYGAELPPTSLRMAADRAHAAFDVAMVARDADAAAAAVLDLEQAITDWTADTLQSDDGDHARRTLRGMVLELATAARDGLADPAARIAPLVDALLERRAAARSARDFATADALRDRLAAAGVEVRDGPSGVQWSLRT